MVFQWKLPGLFQVDAQKAGEELQKVEQKYGRLTAADIVAESTLKDSVLHDCFEWDNNSAAQKYRENQASGLIRNIVVVQVTDKKPIEPFRAFVNVCRTNSITERSYISVDKALSDNEFREQLLKTALSELAAFKNKYSALKELSAIFEAINALPKTS